MSGSRSHSSLPRLNRVLRLEDPQHTADGAGGYGTDWRDLGLLWCEVVALTGRNAGRRGEPVSLQRYKIMLRAAPVGAAQRPKPEQRLRDDNRIYTIDAVAEADPEGRYLTCFATEELAT